MNRFILPALLLSATVFAIPAHATTMVDASASIKAGIDAPARDLAGTKIEKNYFHDQEAKALLLDEKLVAISFERGPVETYQSLSMNNDVKFESEKQKNAGAIRLGIQKKVTLLGSIE